MAKKFFSLVLVIVAYVIPMGVGLSLGCPYAGWIFVPLLISIIIGAVDDSTKNIVGSGLIVIVLGIVVAVMVFLSGNFYILWASVVMLIVHAIFNVESPFAD